MKIYGRQLTPASIFTEAPVNTHGRGDRGGQTGTMLSKLKLSFLVNAEEADDEVCGQAN